MFHTTSDKAKYKVSTQFQIRRECVIRWSEGCGERVYLELVEFEQVRVHDCRRANGTEETPLL